ncbi:FAD-dependent oxidoreductase [Spirosoma rhododendri]|uniref:FAD-dependent oxidoreductase n=2 Tax=Spirosoma rhododendri TaxID=2728024 RepID=A0A7L5DL56_9BACT|nr:FAD-dependent oxidoreductase [Spirosoma rhododendri]
MLMNSSSTPVPVLIVGAGMAGLACAVRLKAAGIDALLLDGSDGVGGRVRTDLVDGFRLDRGFQILLTAYPEAQRLLRYDDLDLARFRSGALIRNPQADAGKSWLSLFNPFQEPLSVFQTLASPIGTLADKLRIVELLRQTQSLPIDELFQQTPTTTLQRLHELGFSDRIIDLFFRPFFGGVFLEDALTTSSTFFDFCFRMFFSGDAAVPALGIGELANQLARRLSPEQIQLNSPVAQLDGTRVMLADGRTIQAETVVLAVDPASAARLLNRPAPDSSAFNHTTCTYFATPDSWQLPADLPKKMLMLNPRRSSAVHNMTVVSDIAPSYAPAGQRLISVSTQGLETVNEDSLTDRIRRELTDWFGEGVQQWRHLRTYHIPQALPAYSPASPSAGLTHRPLKLADKLYQCGDQSAYPSLNAALQTGRLVAEQILRAD